ncbi:hypothetical protein [Treponema brennaborense]|uniref:Uncharacterized protein n=1 Tax=Treponema brennaborense (strain DSM 12168 / CIP 105900 / DD5/3) TaxID=906968 RepID=F4LNE1_TREBD|nr:hypothetical protein [Treponema brennaborense]AEE17899.1 hypothetical protein Trebr_2493 [Treponema brennaborense DSM 12168]
MYEDELAPEIAALLNEAQNVSPKAAAASAAPIKSAAEPDPVKKTAAVGVPDVDLSVRQFQPIQEFFSSTPSPIFDDPAYYKTALTGESESAQRLHTLLTKYLTAQDPKDRTVYRQQIVNVYWEFLRSLAPKMNDPSLPLCKRTLMRFAVVLPSLFTHEQKELFSSVFFENTSGEPVFYLDEWFREIAAGRLTLSATDEARPARKNTGNPAEETARLMQLKSKNSGKLQNAENLLNAKESQRAMIEAELKSRVDQICQHDAVIGLGTHKAPYSESQKRMFAEVTERLRLLAKIDKELGSSLAEFQEAKNISDSLDTKINSGPAAIEVSKADVFTELDTVRQMAKMTVGRQGNHFPVFTREYFHCMPRATGFRENVIDVMAWIESVDPGAFCRIHKNVSNRIVPYVILIPTYGDTGFCWEPFDRYNRITSRGRIAVPMYPKDLKIALLTAVADLRWQVAKEKASYYWMEEGLTGQYYQWLVAQKLKGDVKDYFINDYVLWMTKESEGVQRLDKEVRGVFWRHMPFSPDIKEKLKTRSLVYQELYQRDINRSMSDGY